MLSPIKPPLSDLLPTAQHPWRIVQRDAVELLAALPDASVDLVLTDAAYESQEKHRARGTTTRLSISKGSSNMWFPTVPNRVLVQVVEQVYRVLRPRRHAYFICDDETSSLFVRACEEAGLYVWKSIPLLKVRGTPAKLRGGETPPEVLTAQLRGGMGYHYGSTTERAVFVEKRTKRYCPPPYPAPKLLPPGKGRDLHESNMPDVLTAVWPRKGFPAEKPVSLLRTLIEQSTEPGEVVVDPFFGSGATGEAALQLGRRVLGGDLFHVDGAIERLGRQHADRPVAPAPVDG